MSELTESKRAKTLAVFVFGASGCYFLFLNAKKTAQTPQQIPKVRSPKTQRAFTPQWTQ